MSHRMQTPAAIALLATLMLGCATPDFKPAASYGTKADKHWMAFLDQASSNATDLDLVVAQFDASGQRVGDAVWPLGKAVPIANARPAIAYSSKADVFLVVAVERVTPATGPAYHRVVARFFDSSGVLLQPLHHLFDDGSSTLHQLAADIDVSPLRVTYNPLLDEFLVTTQRTVSQVNGIWAQRISLAAGAIGAPTQWAGVGLSGIASHAVAHAPVAGTQPAGGRYLLAYGGINVALHDSQGKLVSVVPLDYGSPSGGDAHPDIAYGTVDGKDRFLIVYGDDNNCRPGTPPCQQWTGVWGTYVDPLVTSYSPKPINTPFPISKIWTHVANKYTQPRVSYSAQAKAFIAVWREIPFLDPQNGESRSHIRANYVDYFVPDGIANTALVPAPHDNLVVFPVSGSCAASIPCLSVEDPGFPEVKAIGQGKVAVFWHQFTDASSKFLQVRGKVIQIP